MHSLHTSIPGNKHKRTNIEIHQNSSIFTRIVFKCCKSIPAQGMSMWRYFCGFFFFPGINLPLGNSNLYCFCWFIQLEVIGPGGPPGGHHHHQRSFLFKDLSLLIPLDDILHGIGNNNLSQISNTGMFLCCCYTVTFLLSNEC